MAFTHNLPAPADTAEEFRSSILRHVRYTLGRPLDEVTPGELLLPVSKAVCDLLIDGLLKTEQRVKAADAKRLHYLSMEFLMGRTLSDNLCNLNMLELCREVLAELHVDPDEVLDTELDTGLGNGGLGRLAACFLESMATLGLPGNGYGIDYEYGLFTQVIANGWQREKPDQWKRLGTPFHIQRPEHAVVVPLYGRVEGSGPRRRWVHESVVVGMPHDIPVAGYGGETVNYLRLFSARASEEFDIEIFNRGDYIRAIERKIASENLSRVLYPSDQVKVGRELRLMQEYFLVACAVCDIVRGYQARHSDLAGLPEKAAIQLNDTHPSLAVAELMRVLVDDNGMEWKRAWEVTENTLAYTNHTLLPEALERWPVSLVEHVLPRHLQIIYDINQQLLETVGRSFPGDLDRQRRMSIIEEGAERQVRMALLATYGSHSVNGVSALHSELVKTTLVPDFAGMWPERFNNKTNGVSIRRWLLKANPPLAELLCERIGEGWITDARELRKLEAHVDAPGFLDAFAEAKRQNKYRLSNTIAESLGVMVDPASMFDVQVKRFHEYKRQLLYLLRVVGDYLRIVEDGATPPVAKTCVFAGKSAPGYWEAKQIIKLINNAGEVINNDPRVKDMLKVVFLPDYRVSLAEAIIPAADVSEQISTAGMEASGTGNMKFALNGALTVGTYDGANIEISTEVGPENIYIFGNRAEQIAAMRAGGTYRPQEIYERDARVRRIVDAVTGERFTLGEPGLFAWMREYLLAGRDRWFHVADLPAYLDVSERIEGDFGARGPWMRKAALNTARTGFFSSDRTIGEYAEEIWRVARVK